MALTIDWGTLVISVPVIVATSFGAIKYFGKIYFDRRLSDYNAELNQKQSEYLKRLDIELERNKKIIEYYTPKYIAALESTLKVIRDSFIFLEDPAAQDIQNCFAKEKFLQGHIEATRVYLSNDNLQSNLQRFQKEYSEATSANYHYQRNKTDIKLSDNHSEKIKALKDTYDNIVCIVQKELSGR